MTDSLMKAIVCRIKTAIANAGFASQTEFAMAIGVPRPTLSSVLRGKKDVKLSTLVKIATALNLPLISLLQDSDELDEAAGQMVRPSSRPILKQSRIPTNRKSLKAACSDLLNIPDCNIGSECNLFPSCLLEHIEESSEWFSNECLILQRFRVFSEDEPLPDQCFSAEASEGAYQILEVSQWRFIIEPFCQATGSPTQTQNAHKTFDGSKNECLRNLVLWKRYSDDFFSFTQESAHFELFQSSPTEIRKRRFLMESAAKTVATSVAQLRATANNLFREFDLETKSSHKSLSAESSSLDRSREYCLIRIKDHANRAAKLWDIERSRIEKDQEREGGKTSAATQSTDPTQRFLAKVLAFRRRNPKVGRNQLAKALAVEFGVSPAALEKRLTSLVTAGELEPFEGVRAGRPRMHAQKKSRN